MLRRLHSLAGLALALMLLVIASTGVILSLEPAANRLAYPGVAAGTSVAALADGVAARHVRVDTIRVRGDGAVTAAYNDGAGKTVEIVDPRTGAGLGTYETSAFFRFVVDLHRSLLHGRRRPHRRRDRRDRAARALRHRDGVCLRAASAARSALLRPIRGDAARRWHGELGRAGARRPAAVVADGGVSRRHDLRRHPDPRDRAAGDRRERRAGRADPQPRGARRSRRRRPQATDLPGPGRRRGRVPPAHVARRSAGRSVHRRDAGLRADDRDRADRRMGAICSTPGGAPGFWRSRSGSRRRPCRRSARPAS